MAKQNIYDNEIFFEGYKKIRDNEANANNLFEIPALFSMMPDLTGKRVLDLGCGFGEHCMRCIRQGAEKVVGIDIFEKMLEVARKEHSDAGITYVNMPMEEISQLNETFDVVVSSLAFHYVEDFSGVVRNIYDLLEPGGNFIFTGKSVVYVSFRRKSVDEGRKRGEVVFEPCKLWCGRRERIGVVC